MAQRRKFASLFIEPYRQVKLGLMFLILNLVFAAAILGTFGYYLYDVYKSIKVYFELSGAQSVEISSKLSIPMGIGAGLILGFVVITILIAVKYTHRIYGPLVSIHRYLDDILSNRRAKPLVIRESDQLQELASKLNQVAEIYVNEQRQSTMVPVYRFLDDLIEGRTPTPLQLRDTDAMGELASKLNKIADMLGASRKK